MKTEDVILAELKETIRYCRENIRRRMRDGGLVITNSNWDSIWHEMRKVTCSKLLTSAVECQLRSWFQLYKEFPIEKSKGDFYTPAKGSTKTEYSFFVQPGDLWIDCGSAKQDANVVSRSSYSSNIGFDSPLQNTAELHIPLNLRELDEYSRRVVERESTSSSTHCDISTWDVKNFHRGLISPTNEKTCCNVLPASTPRNTKLVESRVRFDTNPLALRPFISDQRRCNKLENYSSDPARKYHCSPPRSFYTNKRDFPKRSNSTSYPRNTLKVSSSMGMVCRKRDTKLKSERKASKQRISVCSTPRKHIIFSRKLSGRPLVSSQKTKGLRRSQKSQNLASKEHGKSTSPNAPDEILKSKKKFPPEDYVYKKGDWVAHAIVSSSASPDELRQILNKKGYELKYIIKRKCTIPNKWVCSLVASADQTHILTSENIWLKGWEVDFVCNEEEISNFLKD